MKKLISVTTAGEFVDALENWIIDNKLNPQTPEEWERCMKDLIKSGVLTPVGSIEEEEVGEMKKHLKENNLNVEDL